MRVERLETVLDGLQVGAVGGGFHAERQVEQGGVGERDEQQSELFIGARERVEPLLALGIEREPFVRGRVGTFEILREAIDAGEDRPAAVGSC